MKCNIKETLILSEKRLKSSKVSNTGFIEILAKTYGNYFFVMQSVKVLKNMKKDDNALVGFGKVLLSDMLMDVAQWLAKPEDKE